MRMVDDKAFDVWLEQIESSCRLRQLVSFQDMIRQWRCTEADDNCLCKQRADEFQRQWTAEMKRSIYPRLHKYLSPFVSSSTDRSSRDPDQASFRIMDLPLELRQMVWSYTQIHWLQGLKHTHSRTRVSQAPYLLKVSCDVCREASPLIVFDLVIDTRNSVERCNGVNLVPFWRHLEIWMAASPHCIINQLTRLRIKLVTDSAAYMNFTFHVNREGDLLLERYEFPWTGIGKGVWIANAPVEAVVVAALESSVQKLKIQNVAKSLRGLRLFEVVTASKAIWQKLMDDNRDGMNITVSSYLREASEKNSNKDTVDHSTVYWHWFKHMMMI